MRRAWIILAPLWVTAHVARCETFERLNFAHGREVVIGSTTFRLGPPDDPLNPSVWEGPLEIVRAGRSCQARVSLVVAVHASSSNRFIVVVTNSGSISYVNFIDSLSCAARWPRIKSLTDGVRLVRDRLEILPGCECGDAGQPCSCTAAQVFRLGTDQAPVFLRTDSLKLTGQVIGVEFSGERQVLIPKTSHVRLLEK